VYFFDRCKSLFPTNVSMCSPRASSNSLSCSSTDSLPLARSRKCITYTVWACTVFVVAYMTTITFTIVFSCIPFSAFWDQVVSSRPTSIVYHCIDEGAILLAASAISVVQDFIIALLPMLLLWRLQIKIRQKTFLSATLAVGFFLCITGILRIVYIYKIFTKLTTSRVSHNLSAFVPLCACIYIRACINVYNY